MIQADKLVKDLMKAGVVTKDQQEKARDTIEASLPPETYNKAVVFLGWATVALAVGSMVLAGLGKEVPEALWGTLGAGIGGLAGIFMARA